MKIIEIGNSKIELFEAKIKLIKEIQELMVVLRAGYEIHRFFDGNLFDYDALEQGNITFSDYYNIPDEMSFDLKEQESIEVSFCNLKPFTFNFKDVYFTDAKEVYSEDLGIIKEITCDYYKEWRNRNAELIETFSFEVINEYCETEYRTLLNLMRFVID